MAKLYVEIEDGQKYLLDRLVLDRRAAGERITLSDVVTEILAAQLSTSTAQDTAAEAPSTAKNIATRSTINPIPKKKG